MKLPRLSLVAGMILCIVSGIDAQDLQLVYGKRSRTVTSGTFIQIELPNPNNKPCANCPLGNVTGRLIAVNDDSLQLRVVESTEYLLKQNENVGYNLKKYTSEGEGPLINIPKTDVLSIIIKGKNKEHDMHPYVRISYALGILALGALALTALDDNTSEGFILGCTAVMLNSLIASYTVRQPFYKTSEQSGYKKSSHEIWKLN